MHETLAEEAPMKARKQRNSDDGRHEDAARYDPLTFVTRHPSPDEIVADAIEQLKADLREVFKQTDNA